jgi:hypothetical protein
MPIRKVSGGYKWGKSGKTYPTKAGAQKQAQAAYASGYKGYKNGGPVAKSNRPYRAVNIPVSGIASLPPGFGGFSGPSSGSVGINVGPQGVGVTKSIDPGSVAGSQSISEAYGRFIQDLLSGGNTSSQTAQRFREAGPSTNMALQRMFSGVYNAPGGDSTKSVKGRNAAMRGTQRARVKEQKAYKRAVRNAAMKYDPAYWVESLGIPLEVAEALAADFKSKYSPEYFANKMKEKNMGLGSVMKESWDSFADSRGVPYNIDELMANYEETGELLPGSGGDG